MNATGYYGNTVISFQNMTKADFDIMVRNVRRLGPQALSAITGDRADASVMTYCENYKTELWAFETLTEADKVSMWHSIQAFGFM